MNFEIELKNLIRNKYKSISSFSRELNIPYSTINNIFERGIMGVSVQVALKICTALNIDIEKIPDDRLILKNDLNSDNSFLLYSKLDEIDKAEIRGEMKQMLKADKYSQSDSSAAFHNTKRKSGINAVFHTNSTDDDSAALALQVTTVKN